MLKFDSRHSFITGTSATTIGARFGLTWKRTLSLGVGYHWLRTEIEKSVKSGGSDVVGLVRFRYLAPFIEYSFYNKGNWEATIPFQIGLGKSFIETPGNFRYNSGTMIQYEPAMTIEYKVLNIVGLGTGIGYRLMLKANREIEERFTSPVFMLRFRIIFDSIIPPRQGSDKG